MKHNKFFWALLSFVALLVGCSQEDNNGTIKPVVKQKSIVILYENDVHCAINGYPKFVGLRDAIAASDTAYVGMVSDGDFLQGALAGAYSHGQYIVDIMKNIDYDAITLGNHEFDYGTPHMLKLLSQIGSPVVSTNFFKYGEPTPIYPGYIIKQYGDKKVAFVGTTTPETMSSEAYAFYDKEGKLLYDLRTDDVYQLVQTAADQARSEGADYVVVLSHLGEVNPKTGVTSYGLVAATTGIDAVLDGHTHSVIPSHLVANKDGKMIPVSQSGTQFANVGKLWITPEGTCHTMVVPTSDIPYANARITATVDSINTLLHAATSRKVATVAFDLPAKDAAGAWIVRKEEAPLGNLIADAFRNGFPCDIGMINGGGVRNDITAGTIEYGDMISIQPNDNKLCLIEVTGQKLMNMLTKCTERCPEADGSFPQVSGLKFTIHTVSHTVTDVMVLDRTTGNYQPLDFARTYTMSTTDYYANGGMYDTIKNCPLLATSESMTRDIIAVYLEQILNGVVGDEYRQPQGRITIVND